MRKNILAIVFAALAVPVYAQSGPTAPPPARTLELAGPRFGVTMLSQGVIDKLRTWPWRTETVSGLGLAFLVPILIWIIQRVLERLGL